MAKRASLPTISAAVLVSGRLADCPGGPVSLESNRPQRARATVGRTMDLVEIVRAFPDESDCLARLEAIRWKGRPVCPYCKHWWSSPVPKEGRHHCNNCGTTFSVTAQTIFHRTRVDMRKWFLAIYTLIESRRPPSARDLATLLEVNKNTASQMLLRLRYATVEERQLLAKIAEVVTERTNGARSER